MSEEGNKKLYAHYKSRAEGSYKSGNTVRNELVKADGKKHLADLIKKNPSLEVKEEPKEETKPKSKKVA